MRESSSLPRFTISTLMISLGIGPVHPTIAQTYNPWLREHCICLTFTRSSKTSPENLSSALQHLDLPAHDYAGDEVTPNANGSGFPLAHDRAGSHSSFGGPPKRLRRQQTQCMT